jgi:putative sterol carrier protein
VLRFLSDEWIAALDRAAVASEALRSATRDVSLTVQQVVTATANDDGDECDEVSWHVVIDHGAVRVRPGRAVNPEVTFTEDAETAGRISRGELSAQAAFMLGKLRVGGDAQHLAEHQRAFASLEDVFAEVRASTNY